MWLLSVGIAAVHSLLQNMRIQFQCFIILQKINARSVLNEAAKRISNMLILHLTST